MILAMASCNCDHIVNYDRKTFMLQATGLMFAIKARANPRKNTYQANIELDWKGMLRNTLQLIGPIQRLHP